MFHETMQPHSVRVWLHVTFKLCSLKGSSKLRVEAWVLASLRGRNNQCRQVSIRFRAYLMKKALVCTNRMCFSNCVATDISDVAWKQAQLGLSYGGLGLRSISHHSCAAYIASLSFSGLGSADNPHLVRSIVRYNSLVSPPDGISVESILASPIPQRILSQRLDDHSFGLVIAAATDADKARLLSTTAPHAASWLSVVPSVGIGLHLDSNELQIAVK